MHKILVVEDDLVIAEAVSQHLKTWDYEVRYVTEFKDVMSQFSDFCPHLVLLDISLPFMNGYHWCGEMRKKSQVPIVFLSSTDDNMSIVMAMNMGADDFISKPFDLAVLSAKVGAIIRRAYSFGGHADVLEYGGVTLNLGDASITFGTEKMELTKNEFKILQTLFETPGRVVGRDALMIKLWESEVFIDDNTLTVNMTRLRKKLSDIGLEGLIATKKGMGYMVV